MNLKTFIYIYITFTNFFTTYFLFYTEVDH